MVLVNNGVEVSEKRGRHWVRLPFACGLRVLGEVVLNAEVALRQLAGALGNHAAGNARGHTAETGQTGAATAWHGEGGRG